MLFRRMHAFSKQEQHIRQALLVLYPDSKESTHRLVEPMGLSKFL